MTNGPVTNIKVEINTPMYKLQNLVKIITKNLNIKTTSTNQKCNPQLN